MTKPKKGRDGQKKRKNAFPKKGRDGIEKRQAHASAPSPSPERPKGPPWLYGRHAVIAALQNPDRNCHRLIATQEFIKNHGDELRSAVGATARKRPETEILDRRDIEDILGPQAGGAVHQGIALQAAPLAHTTLEEFLPSLEDNSSALVVALDQATDPQNIGAVLRSAAAFGASAVLIPERNAPEITASMAKAACGALERIAFIRVTNLSRSLDTLKEEGFWSVGLDGYAETTLSKIDMKGKTVLVMGSEGSGLRRLTKEKCDFLAKIPISHTVESLNLSNATAVALYEITRQKEA